MSPLPPGRPNPPPNLEWLARKSEPALEPDMPIIDPHHHLWDVVHKRYLLDEILEDVRTGHNIRSTVLVEARSMFRADGPEEFKCVGEVEFANGIAAMAASGLYGPTRICAGIVSHADLRVPNIAAVLEALERAGGERFKGVRHNAAQDEDVRKAAPEGLLRDPDFRRGFEILQKRGHRFDAWLYHPQIDDLVDLMRHVPEARLTLNHVGGRIGIGRFKGHEAETFAAWKRDIAKLAPFPNLTVKLGGLGMFFTQWGFHERAEPPSSDDLVAAWSDTIHTVIDIFGPSRCMFESNFPVDKISASYGIIWNAFKKMSKNYSVHERRDLFHDTAQRFYDLPTY